MALIPRALRPSVTRDGAPQLMRRFSSGQSLSTLGSGMASSGGVARWDPAKALSEAYYANVFVYACTRAIAQDLASRPFRVGADPSKPLDFNVQHPLALRLGPAPGGPNPDTTANQLRRWSLAQKIVTGAFAWEIDSDLRFWPLLIRLLKPIPTDGKPGDAGYFKAFEYGDGQNKRIIPAKSVFYDFTPSQDDWRLPETALQAARLDVSVMVMQDKYDNAFLRNDARPATVIVHEAFEDPDQQRAFRRGFVADHRGPDNAGKTHFVSTTQNGAAPNDALVIKTLGLSQRDTDSIRRYDAKIRSVCISLGVPLSRLGDASGSTFNNSSIETLNYWRDTVKPAGDELIDSVNLHLMPLFDNSGNVGFLDYTGIPDLEPVKRFAITDVPALLRDEVITRNEARVEVGLPRVEDAAFDEYGSGVVAAPIPALSPAPAPTAAPVAASAESIAQAVQAALAPAVADLAADIAAARRDTATSLVTRTMSLGDATVRAIQRGAERRQRLWRSTDRATQRLEKAWSKAFDQLFSEQAEAVAKRLEGKRGRQAATRAADDGEDVIDPSAVFDSEFWEKRTKTVATTLYETTAAEAATMIDASFDIAFDLDSKAAKDFILARASTLAGQITQTTYTGIQQALVDGAAKGESIPDLANRIRSLFSQTYASRATTVARTEVISAYNGATHLAIQEADKDVVGGLEWISTADDRTRDAHAEIDGTIIAVGELFSVDGEDLEYPGDPNGSPENVINCRCTVAPVVVDDMPPPERSIPRASVERVAVRLARGDVDFASALLELDDSLT